MDRKVECFAEATCAQKLVPQRQGWILGWAIPQAWFSELVREAFRARPSREGGEEHEHLFFAASPEGLEQLREQRGTLERLTAYSLGAHLLLRHPELARDIPDVNLLAPVFGLTAESQVGGRIPQRQLDRWAEAFSANPEATARRFHAWAGLDLDAHSTRASDGEINAWQWGVEQLRQSLPLELPKGWRGWIGREDRLVDAQALARALPGMTVVDGASHHPAALLAALVSSRARAPSTELVRPVQASFDASAHGYWAHAKVQIDLAAWLAEWLPEDRSGDVLEVGAGPGVFTSHLVPWNGAIVATDLAREMCAQGASRFPHLTWCQMPAEEPLPGPWHWIVSSSALQWIEDPKGAFLAWRKVMVEKGHALVGFFVAGTLEEWSALTDMQGPLRWRSAEVWKEALVRAGWKIRRAEVARRIYRYPSALALLQSLRAVGAAPSRVLSPGKIKAALGAYPTRFTHPEGGVRATWMFFRCEAEIAPGRPDL